ncbi:phosphatase PAP2 family protein [Granulicella sp. WH15]|uniref:phosphatase PAP2 family protein n=1 Tax=Granulicella sp. WH15 TaxID=2602070 RepID=UPI001366F19E|nr:phosphatase PAP2 family protein [Granulicella sp. WH15]QHN02116.1 phosphatase PAP2 family protein [Granulicella sp. WH15]
MHRNTCLLAAWAVLCCSAGAWAQEAKPAKEAKEHSAYYIDASVVRLAALLPAPPAAGSATVQEELATLHRIEAARTPAQVAAAKADDEEEDIFSFRTVLGDSFRADLLPLTAALSAHVHNEEGVASGEAKKMFARPRPYQADKTLHPVCAVTEARNSYPSGHTLSGYLLAFTLAELLPERKQQILDRADDYAHNRLVCGVHYPSDLDASRRAAYLVFGYMLATPRFAHDLDAARIELRAHPEFTSASK